MLSLIAENICLGYLVRGNSPPLIAGKKFQVWSQC